MKKLIGLICLVLVSLTLVSCGGKEAVTGDGLLKKGNTDMQLGSVFQRIDQIAQGGMLHKIHPIAQISRI